MANYGAFAKAYNKNAIVEKRGEEAISKLARAGRKWIDQKRGPCRFLEPCFHSLYFS